MNSELTEKKLQTQNSEIIYPSSRRFYPIIGTGCNNTTNEGCRSIQIRNVPDLGQVPYDARMFSNPGCTHSISSAKFNDCPQTDEWEDKGRTYQDNSFNNYGVCRHVKNTEDGSATRYTNTTKTSLGRMRVCERKTVDINKYTSVRNVCALRQIMFEHNLSAKKDENCNKSNSTTPTCQVNQNFQSTIKPGSNSRDGFLNNPAGGSKENINTDMSGQFQQEFRYPLYNSSSGLPDVIYKKFRGEGPVDDPYVNISQYTTCNSSIWGDPSYTESTNYTYSASLVLPSKSDAEKYLEERGILTSNENIDSIYATTGFWPNSYNKYVEGQNQSLAGVSRGYEYHGLTTNGYPGALNFLEAFPRFKTESGSRQQQSFINEFVKNVPQYLDSPSTINSDAYPNLKQSLIDMCNRTKIFNPEVRQTCALTFQDICKTGQITKNDLVGNDLNKVQLRAMCSCNMTADQYPDQSTPSEQPGAACDNTCLTYTTLENAFPAINNNGTEEICRSTICIISDVDINIIESSTGSINIQVLCGEYCKTQGCICYMDNVSVNQINSNVEGGVTISQECNVCYEVQDGNYSQASLVDCDTGNILENSGGNPIYADDTLQQTTKWASDNKYWLLPVLATLFGLAVIAAIVVLFMPKKASKKDKTISYNNLPTEDSQGVSSAEMQKVINETSQANNQLKFEQTGPNLDSLKSSEIGSGIGEYQYISY